jgi:C_GCAxxG_C_C family probable redox protein
MTRKEKAVELFMNGANCAQAVAGAFADLMGMTEGAAMRLSSGFGGGVARQREVCGAVSGMVMVASALYGYDALDDDAVKAAHYRLIRTLCDTFRERWGSIVCRELVGAKKSADTVPEPDPRTAEYYRQRPCAALVGTAAEILEKYITENPVF